MTLSEFKAWFEGYTEDLVGAPTEQQFARIKEKVKAIDGAPTTYPIFVDRWWPQQPITPYWSTISGVAYGNAPVVCNVADGNPGFDSHAAMFALGKADALAA
jgi:hypothetical protein